MVWGVFEAAQIPADEPKPVLLMAVATKPAPFCVKGI
jgi:hypothetical protein